MSTDLVNKDENRIVEGSLWKQLFLFFLPILFANFFQQFYSVVDAIVVGRVLGENALAAIDSTWSLFRIPTSFFVGVSTGATILLGQAFGAKDHVRFDKLIHTAAWAALVFGVLFSVVILFLCSWLLSLIKAPDDIFKEALIYSRFYSAGLFIVLIFNIVCAVLRAIGDSKRPFYFLVCSSLTNIVLDILFVIGFDWGIAGAAIATILSQALSAVLAIHTLMRAKGSCRLYLKKIRANKSVLSEVFRAGLPVGLQSMLYPVANTLIQRSLNSFGKGIIAAWAINGKLDFILWLVIDSFAASCSTFVAQNYGARKYQRVKQSICASLTMAGAIVIALSVLFYFYTGSFGRIFLDDNWDTIHLAEEIMRFIAPWYITAMFGEILAAGIRSKGKTFESMLITLISSCLVRVIWILFVAPLYPSPYITLAVFPVSWITCSLAFIIVYLPFRKIKHI